MTSRTIFHINYDGKRWLLLRLGKNTVSVFHTIEEAKAAGMELARENAPSQLVIQDSRSVFEYIEFDPGGTMRNME